MDPNEQTFKLSWWQRRKYSGRFIAYENNNVITSGKSYWECRHRAREKLSENRLKTLNKDKLQNQIRFQYIEKKSNVYRGIIVVIVGFLLFELMMLDLVTNDNVLIYRKLEVFLFFNFLLLSIFLASLMIINPVVRTQSVFGLLGVAIVNKERHLGWEVSLSGITAFIFVGSIVVFLITYIEFGISLNTIYIFYLGVLLIFQSFFAQREERNLKKLHYYLLDQITLEDRLTYKDIASYLSDIPEIKNKGLSNSNSLIYTLEASLESPFSLTRVIAFRILFRDVALMIGSVFISFAIGYLLYFQGIMTNLIGSRVFASILSAGLLLYYALIKRSTSDLFAEGFVQKNPHFTLRPGGVDRIYMKFFPHEVIQMKKDTISTILTQSVRLTAGLGIFLLLYGMEMLISLTYIKDYDLITVINSMTLALGAIPLFIFILYVAREGTKKWVESIEIEMTDLDKKLEVQIGMTPNEILSYLQEAQSKYTQLYSKQGNA